MADPRHLTRLLSGVGEWNNHRYGNASFRPDLRNADLSKQTLFGIDLRDAQMEGANFSSALLNGASFTEANLTGATFADAALNNAYLLPANLEGADLKRLLPRHTIFRGSNMH